MTRRTIAVLLLLFGPATAGAADPCPDLPSYPGFRCRVAQLNQQTLLRDATFKNRTRRLAIVANAGAGKCVAGKTGPARKKLRKSRRLLAKVAAELPKAAGRTVLPAVHRRELESLIERTEALRRAAESRLVRSDCPALIEIARPAPEETVGDDVYVFATLDRRTDSGSVSLAMFPVGRPGSAQEVPLTQRSRGTVWGRAPCPRAGSWTLRLRARDQQALHTEEVTVHCGATGAIFGGDVEALVLPDGREGSLRIEPVRPLASGATYAVVVTTALGKGKRRRAIASPTFRRVADVSGQATSGAIAHYTDDANDPLNPFPDDRLRRGDGTITIPVGFTDRTVPPESAFDGTRTFLAGLDGLCEEHRGFSASTAIVVHFEPSITLKNVPAGAIRVLEVRRPGEVSSPDRLVDALVRERGIDRSEVALAFTFTTEDLGGELATIREQIAARAASSPPTIDFTPRASGEATRPFGVYAPSDPEFAGFFDGPPPAAAGLVARGTFPSPDYRVDGRIPDAFLDGSAVPPSPDIDVVIVRPTGPVPPGGFPVVILQHGFCGSDAFVTDAAADFLDAGLAVAGISAPEHGLRGACLTFFDFGDFNAFGNNFRQATIDLLQLTQVLARGVDLGGGGPDVAGDGIGYLGVSLGGVIGGTFGAVEPNLVAAVLNVPGGRLAQFAGSTSSLALPFLEQFAVAAGLTTRTCGGAPDGTTCATDADCEEEEETAQACVLTEAFAIMLDAALPSFQCQLDPGDPITYARGWRIAPPATGPRAVLVQEGIGDVIVANPLTEALARGIGLAEQRPDSNEHGTAGIWRVPEAEPPAENEDPKPDGHAIFQLPEVRSQAVTFLASGGTELIAPPEEPLPAE